jgi:transposase InsO family protein
MWLHLLTSKDEVPAAIKRFKAQVETETGKKLRVLRTDRGGEFTLIEFGLYYAEQGVKCHLTAPYSPQQNGVMERRNQTVVGMARSMLKAKKEPAAFWGEAVSMPVLILLLLLFLFDHAMPMSGGSKLEKTVAAASSNMAAVASSGRNSSK